MLCFFSQEPKLQVLPPLKKINQALPSRGNKYITTDGGATEAIIINSSDLTSLQTTHQVSPPTSLKKNKIKIYCSSKFR